MSYKYAKILTFFICLFIFLMITVHFNVSVKDKEDKNIKVRITNNNDEAELELPFVTTIGELGISDDQYNYSYVLSNELIIDLDDKSEDKISINKADKDLLETLPGIGSVIAERIIEYRERYGQFECIDDIKYVKGISDKKYEKIRELITV